MVSTQKEAVALLTSPKMREAFERCHVTSVKLFGSFARGEQNEKSDLDVLIDYGKVPDLFQFMDLKYTIEDASGRKVDLVTEYSLRPELRESITPDLKPVL